MGLVRDFGQKVEVFSSFVSYHKSIEKKCLVTFWIEKKPFKAIRTSLLSPRLPHYKKKPCLDNVCVNLPFIFFFLSFYHFSLLSVSFYFSSFLVTKYY